MGRVRGEVQGGKALDLSVVLEHDHPSEPIKPQIAYEDHAATAPLVSMIFGCEPDDLPDGNGWAFQELPDWSAGAGGSGQRPESTDDAQAAPS